MYFTAEQLRSIKNRVNKNSNIKLEEYTYQKLTTANQNTFWFEHELNELNVYIPEEMKALVEREIKKARNFASHCEAIEREELAMM